MQEETVEMEELHIEDSNAKVKKEYEKILIREQNRQKNVKAQNLVKLGCFEQKEEKKIDFSVLDKITYEKLYQKVYDLYEDSNINKLMYGNYYLYEDRDGNMLYIYAKTEGEDARPYAYDVIYIETVSDEDYKKLYRAASFEGAGFAHGLYLTTFILWITSIVVTLSIIIYYVSSGDYDFINVLINSISYIFFIAIITALLAITDVSYRKYIGK